MVIRYVDHKGVDYLKVWKRPFELRLYDISERAFVGRGGMLERDSRQGSLLVEPKARSSLTSRPRRLWDFGETPRTG